MIKKWIFGKTEYATKELMYEYVKGHKDEFDGREADSLTLEETDDAWTVSAEFGGTDPVKVFIELSEFSEDKWYEILREGEHRGGAVPVTKAMLQEYKKNYDAGVRGIWFDEAKTIPTLDIDYDHKKDPAKGKKAAGWFGEVAIRPSSLDEKKVSLWMKPKQITPDAQDAIKKGEYKGFSVEIAEDYMDEATGKTYKYVLLGGGLTNRPEVKHMVPIALSEEARTKRKKEATRMKLAELAEKHKITVLDEDTDETIADKLDEKLTKTQSDLGKMQKEKQATRRVAFIEKAKGKIAPAELEEDSDTLAEFDKNPDYMEKLIEKLPVHPEFKEKPKGKNDDGHSEPDGDESCTFDELLPAKKQELTRKYMSEKNMKAEQFAEAADIVRKEFNEAWSKKQAEKGAK